MKKYENGEYYAFCVQRGVCVVNESIYNSRHFLQCHILQ